MPRAIWSGAISFGLVNVPVRMYSAIEEHDLHFHLLHSKDDSRIGYEKICKKEGKPVPADEIVKAYEYEKGKYVYVTDENFEAAEVEGYKTIDIEDFVPYADIDPIYFEKTYYLGPDRGAEKVYALMRDAMEKSGLAGIGKFVMRERQHLGCLRVREGVITLERMYFADEIRPVDDVSAGGAKVSRRELDMALDLIDRFAGKFEPERYEDTYRESLRKIIQAKSKGKEVHVEAPVKEEKPTDLMEALRASLEAAQQRRGKRTPARSGGKLDSLSKDQLYARAKKADVKGRSEMSREELIEALQEVA